MRKALFDPNFTPTFDDAKIILNNLKFLPASKEKAPVLYQLLNSHAILKGFGTMYLDHPLENLNMNDLEKLFIEYPNVIEQISDLKISDFNFDNVPTPSTEGLSKDKFNWRPFQPALCVSALATLVATDLNFEMTNILLSPILAYLVFVVLDSPFYMNGVLTKSILWAKAQVEYSVPHFKRRALKHTSAALIVAYFTGVPVIAVDTDPSLVKMRRKSEYAEAPRIEMVDPSIGVLEGRGKLSLRELQRTIAVHCASIAIDLIEGRPTEVSEYLRFLMAALLERANSVTYSNLKPEDFSTFILPTLLRWGILEAVIILRENRGAYESALKVIEGGGDVGEAILAVDSTFTSDHPVFRRKADRLSRGADRQTASLGAFDYSQLSYAEMIGLVLKAKGTPTPEVEADQPHELIPGTDRIYTREELILKPNPSAEDVKELAQELMQMRIALDRDENGRVPAQTREYIHNLAADVNNALHLFREGRSAAGSPTVEAIQQTMNDKADVLREDAGLAAPQIPPAFSAVLPPVAYEELLVQLNVCNKFALDVAQSFRVWWDLSGRENLHRVTGHGIRSAINNAWRGVKETSTSSEPSPETPKQLEMMLALRKTLSQLNPYESFHLKHSYDDVVPEAVKSTLENIMARVSRRSLDPRASLTQHRGGAFSDLEEAEAKLAEKQNKIQNKLGSGSRY